MLARAYEMKDEFVLLFKAHMKQDLLWSIKLKQFQLTLANLVDIFKTLTNLKLILLGKNIYRINVYNAISAFVAKLGLWHRRIQKGNATSSSKLGIALEKNQAERD